MTHTPETESLIENLLQACVDYERCERFDAKHRRLDLEEAKQAIRNAITAGHAQRSAVPAGMVTCERCMGSGYSNHPDSGEVCEACKGQGGVTISSTTRATKIDDGSYTDDPRLAVPMSSPTGNSK